MTTKIMREGERNWERAMSARAPQILTAIRSTKTKAAMVASIARATGLSSATVRNSLPIANWQRGVKNLTVVDIRRGISQAVKDHSWSNHYVNAYRTPARGSAPARKKSTPKKKKSAPKKKSSGKKKSTPKKKTTSKKKSGGKKKTSPYNRFVKSYYKQNKGKNPTMAGAARAWKRSPKNPANKK